MISIEDYDDLEYDHKKQIYEDNISDNYILSKHGVYVQTCRPYGLVMYSWQKYWQDIQSQWVMRYHRMLNILTIVE